MKFKKKWLLFLMVIFIGWQLLLPEKYPSNVAKLSVSSDGRYIISSHYGRYLVLWDVEHKTKTIVNQNANIHSAYFIPNSQLFLWQDATDHTVYLQNIKGERIKSFNPGFQVYGHVMNTRQTRYIASKDNWSLYTFEDNKLIELKHSNTTLKGSARLLNLYMNENFFLTSGNGFYKREDIPLGLGHNAKEVHPYLLKGANYSLLDGVVLWNTINYKPIKKMYGNVAKTIATLSPDGKKVLAGDEAGFLFLWDIETGKRTRMDDPVNPNLKCYGNAQCLKELALDIRNNKLLPNDFYSLPTSNGERNVSVKFIDLKGHFIRFINSVNYGTLYNMSSPKVKAYISLGSDPMPDMFSIFSSNNLIDTAPAANILVMGQAPEKKKWKGSGIIVYRFDETAQTLKRIWAPLGPPPHKRIHNPDNRWEY